VTPLHDELARRRIREDLDRTFVVEAAAGTGKTTALVSRVVALVRTGRAELQRVVAVTFTEAAAGEMKLRVRAALERARTESTDVERARLDRALAQLEEARISTIHGLCGDLLRERPIEGRVDPLFQIAAEDEQRRLYDQAFDLWFQQTLEDPPPGVRRMLRRKSRNSSPREQLRSAGFELLEHRDFTAVWRREPFDRDREIDRLVDLVREAGDLADLADKKDDWLRQLFVRMQTFSRELVRHEAIRPRDYDALESALCDLAGGREWRWKGSGQYARGRISRAEALAKKDDLKTELDGFAARTRADLAALLHAELTPLIAAYEALKARAGKLDFIDLLLRTRDLVRDNPSVRADLKERFTHIFVDEFQDTDPLQAEIILLLAGGGDDFDWLTVTPPPGKLFLVGDPKQSIYRFRRADVALYEQIKQRLVANGAEVLHLVSSFRSVPAIQRAVNAAFELRMQPNALRTQAEYVRLEPVRSDPSDRPAVVALPVPRPYSDYGKLTKWAIEKSVPDAVGAYVDWLVRHSGWTVTERESPDTAVPIAPRHICLLFKRFSSYETDLTRPYARALEARGIPHVLVGGRSFHHREEIATMRAAATAIEWPDDELSVFATLRGPFFSLGDDALLAFAAMRGHGAFHPLRPIESALTELTQPVANALGILARLHRGRNRRPIADTLGQLLEVTRAHAGIAIWPTGEQSLANVLRLVDIARRFEAAGATSFRAFVEHLEDAAERGTTGDALVVEEGTDGVRMMTVHKAKGLEFPVVILVEPTAPLAQEHPDHYVDHGKRLWAKRIAGCSPIELLEHADESLRRQEEEAVRLVYVAATRARDLLVVPTVGDRFDEGGWVSVLDPALYPHPRHRTESQPARGCPPFGRDSVLERHPEAYYGDAVAPGEHVPDAGEHRVVWWDPRALELDREVDTGLRQQAILVAENETGEDAVATAHQAWIARRSALLQGGATPSLRAASATAIARESVPLSGEIHHERVEGDRTGHPRGKRFGALVHAVLAAVPLDGELPLAALSEAHGRLLGATSDEIAAARVRVERALQHPLMIRAREAARTGRCRREVAIVASLSDVVVDGVVDLAFRDDQGWTVVDFKTDVELDAERARAYETQVRVYLAAIGRATGKPTQGILLSV
jgi:ATP-dependent helicase/nuclease subunit A